jgi:hypothetical protein
MESIRGHTSQGWGGCPASIFTARLSPRASISRILMGMASYRSCDSPTMKRSVTPRRLIRPHAGAPLTLTYAT